MTSGSTCTACSGKDYSSASGATKCETCDTGLKGAPAPGTTSGNTHCICNETTQGLFNKKCIACSGDGYSINATNGNCECTEGYTQDATTGACSKSSSASPLAILIICSLIISIIASIATAAVMIRRKASNARAAEAIVSDAL